MIHLEIINSPDSNVVAQYKFFQNEIYIGFNTGNVFINDPALKPSHLMIEVVEKELIVHPQSDVEFYLIDGKRASTVRKIKIGQTITIGTTNLKITEFEYTEMPSKKVILDQKLSELIEANSHRVEVIEKLAKQMK